jgi:hypothetical protein
MGLEINFKAGSCCDCQVSDFTETTGAYDFVHNPGGYGSPNPASSDVIGAQILVYSPENPLPITFDFTIDNNVIIAATRIDTFGSQPVDVYDLLPNTDFPFFQFEMDSIFLFGDTEKHDLQAGTWRYKETVIFDPETDFYICDEWVYNICPIQKCAMGISAKLGANQISQDTANEFYLKLDALNLAIAPFQNKTQADYLINELIRLCDGCGCCNH